jgi:hypothetical protein
MVSRNGENPLDTRRLSDAVIELNISRRMVSIYPGGHTSIDGSLERALGCFRRLLDQRSEVTIAVARDTLIVDEFSLDKKNPVYREFAETLSRKGIAYVRFERGLSKEELFSFHSMLAARDLYLTPQGVGEVVKEYGFRHIVIEPVDYSAFVVGGGDGGDGDLWEQYIRGLLSGALRAGDGPGELGRIPPQTLAKLLNRVAAGSQEESYEEVITTYLRQASEKLFTGDDLERLIEVIEGLKPRIKGQFLSSSVKILSRDIPRVESVLGDVSVEKVMGFLTSINERNVFVTRSLKSLIERFSRLGPAQAVSPETEDGELADDFIVSREAMDLLEEGRYEEHIPVSYQEELDRMLNRKGPGSGGTETLDREWRDEWIDKEYNQVVLELLAAPVPPSVSQGREGGFSAVLKDQLGLFAASGQYEEILKTEVFLESGDFRGGLDEQASETARYGRSPEFAILLADSFRLVGRQRREGAALLCRHLGASIAPALMDALCEEESQAGRKFLMGLVTDLGEDAVPEATARLRDERWFVKRNMLCILGECAGEELLEDVRPWHRHEDPRVRFEALRFLVGAGDEEGLGTLRQWFVSGKRDMQEQAIQMAGALQVRQFVPELQRMLGRRAMSGREYETRVQIVKAMGQIGDPAVIENLRDILLSTSRLFRKDLDRLKKEANRVLQKLLGDGVQGTREP